LADDGRPGILFADVPIADWRLERHIDNRFKHRVGTTPVLCVPATVGGTYPWLEALESFWLGKAPIEKKPVGRPASTSVRNERIRQLSKTHSCKELQETFRLSQARIAQIVRGEHTYTPRKGDKK
jgi:hypothetical protein